MQKRQNEIQMILYDQMVRDDATMIPHPTYTVELKKTLAYDPSKLNALRELVDPAELESSGAFIPAHQDTVDVPDKWNMTKVKPFSKYGGDVKATIEDSAYVSATRLSIKKKPMKGPSCPLCDKPSATGAVHQECADREQAAADRE
ncbi:hypothetical protein LCGC14_0353570 [marine sediment metagenome]|uniref:Uncharacterized protein n=1 Tax=marine sediment metagenome TaxID=412755 RepID=A0A0F9TA60_9ZZZZ